MKEFVISDIVYYLISNKQCYYWFQFTHLLNSIKSNTIRVIYIFAGRIYSYHKDDTKDTFRVTNCLALVSVLETTLITYGEVSATRRIFIETRTAFQQCALAYVEIDGVVAARTRSRRLLAPVSLLLLLIRRVSAPLVSADGGGGDVVYSWNVWAIWAREEKQMPQRSVVSRQENTILAKTWQLFRFCGSYTFELLCYISIGSEQTFCLS